MNLSSRAAERVMELRSAHGLPDESALRIAPDQRGGNDLAIGFVTQPPADDELGEAHGVRYCVDSSITPMLDAATLDIDRRGDDDVFVLRHEDPNA